MAQNKKIRSQVEMNNPDLNYFIAFKINTKETDVTKLKDALTKKRNTFAAQQTVPKIIWHQRYNKHRFTPPNGTSHFCKA